MKYVLMIIASILIVVLLCMPHSETFAQSPLPTMTGQEHLGRLCQWCREFLAKGPLVGETKDICEKYCDLYPCAVTLKRFAAK